MHFLALGYRASPFLENSQRVPYVHWLSLSLATSRLVTCKVRALVKDRHRSHRWRATRDHSASNP
jgi:hypothetical protein